jgi:hypothetical protein
MAGITELNSNKHTENESKNRLALASQAGIDKRIGRLRELASIVFIFNFRLVYYTLYACMHVHTYIT